MNIILNKPTAEIESRIFVDTVHERSGCAEEVAAYLMKGDTRDIVYLAGGILNIIRAITMVDSHQYFGRAGRLELTPTGVIVKIGK